MNNSMQSKNKNVKMKYETVGEYVSIFKRQGYYHCNIQDGNRQKRKSLRTRNRKVAIARALEFERNFLEQGTAKTPDSGPALISDAIEALKQSCNAEELRYRTITKYMQVLSVVKNFAASLNRHTVDQLDHRFVDAYRQYRKRQKAKPKTIHTELGIIRRLTRFTKTRRMISEDPLQDLKLSEPKTEPQPFWSPSEVEQILNSSSPVHRPLFTFLAETGVRIGEAKYLAWKNVDLVQRVIHIRPTDGWTTKTGNVRTIPLSDRARQLLKKQSRHCRWVFTARASKQFPKGDHQISERRMLESLKRTLKKLGLPGHLHTFRHSFISRAIVAGIPEAIIRSWVGHVDRRTLQHYTHIADQESRSAMQKLNRLAP